MEESYGVYLGSQLVGKVLLRRQGLYCCFTCRCQLSGEVIWRLTVRWEDGRESLGILVPMEGGFGLNTRLPAKRLGSGKLEFYLTPKHEELTGKFVPVYPEEPFSYIEHLKEAYLARKDGQIGVVIR